MSTCNKPPGMLLLILIPSFICFYQCMTSDRIIKDEYAYINIERAYQKGNVEERVSAVRKSVNQLHSNKDFADIIICGIYDPAPEVRLAIVESVPGIAILNLNNNIELVIDDLFSLRNDPNYEVRIKIIDIVKLFPEYFNISKTIIVDALEDEDNSIKIVSLKVISYLAIERFKPDFLWEKNEYNNIILPLLIENIDSSDGDVKKWALSAIIGMGEIPKEAKNTFIELLENTENEELNLYGVWGLTIIGPEPGVMVALRESLPGNKVKVQKEIIRALGHFGPKAEEAADVIYEVMGMEKGLMASGIGALGSIGRNGNKATDMLIEIAKSDDKEARQLSGTCLGNTVPVQSVVDTLLMLVDDKIKEVRISAIQSIGRLFEGTGQDIQKLNDLEKNEMDEEIRGAVSFAKERISGEIRLKGVGVNS